MNGKNSQSSLWGFLINKFHTSEIPTASTSISTVFPQHLSTLPQNLRDFHHPHSHADLCHSTNTQPFNGPLSGTTWVSRYQKGKTYLDFTEARDSELQWHQLGHMQVCTSLQTDNHTSTPPLSFYRPDALPATQSTASKH